MFVYMCVRCEMMMMVMLIIIIISIASQLKKITFKNIKTLFRIYCNCNSYFILHSIHSNIFSLSNWKAVCRADQEIKYTFTPSSFSVYQQCPSFHFLYFLKSTILLSTTVLIYFLN